MSQSLKIYVATKFEAKVIARRMMEFLTAKGHSITHDWTTEDAANNDEMGACAVEDARGVFDCDVLVIIPRPGCRGAWVEFGIALACRKPIVVVSPKRADVDSCIFEHMPDVWHVKTAEELVPVLAHLGGFNDSYRN
jgi:hypothetical protein